MKNDLKGEGVVSNKKISKRKPVKLTNQANRNRRVLLILIFPIIALILIGSYLNESANEDNEKFSYIPKEFIPVYKAAEKEYGVPWYLLAAHHRVETIFSTMDPMLSPAGAEGPMQFMPCTFVGWQHPTCGGLGLGEIPENEKVDPAIIKKYGGYGVDANGDGIADPWDIEDAIYSAANYLSKYGAAEGELREAVYSYNHSEKYVEDVLYYAEFYKAEFEEKH